MTKRMKMMGNKKPKFILLNLLSSLLLLGLIACVPQQSNGRKTKKSSTTAGNNTGGTNVGSNLPTPTPHSELINFIDLNGQNHTGAFSLQNDFNDIFKVKGNGINLHLNGTGNSTANRCLVNYFPNSLTHKIQIIAAIPDYDSVGNTRSYYYRVAANDKTLTQNICMTSGVLSAVAAMYPTDSISYKISDTCPNCLTGIYSNYTKLLTTGGQTISALSTDHLVMRLEGVTTSSNTLSCTSSTDCTAQGYNCCLGGQCVINGAMKSGVDTSSAGYLAAIQAIQANPAVYTSYEDYFYVCQNSTVTPTPTAAATLNPELQAQLDIINLTELNKCVTPRDDGISFCTKIYENAKKDIQPDSFVTPTPTPTTVVFTTNKDDLSFRTYNTNLPDRNITKIKYGEVTLYARDEADITTTTTSLSAIHGSFTATGNDDLTSTDSVSILAEYPPQAYTKDLKVTYTIDGTCERVNAALAKCTKYYIYDATDNTKADYHDTSSTFLLPTYADTTNYAVILKINDVIVPQDPGTTWQITAGNVVFDAGYTLFPLQQIAIQYYVDTNVDDLLESKEAAQTKIKNHCDCPDLNCTLNPTYGDVNGVSTIVSYACVYPTPNLPEPPLQQTVYVDAKAIPHRYFDTNGLNYDSGIDANTPAQEGTAFEYTSGNALKPNNESTYIGFNEILGTMKSDGTSAQPPKMLTVKKGKTYDVFADTGTFSTCTNCGKDYYASVLKLFPQSFLDIGGGYIPNKYDTSKMSPVGSYRADDLLFGRACFVPPTMIPWTHVPSTTSAQVQRQNRLNAQHFLFANGYQRDWYGFDYGSLIGSFDGVRWFSVGNQRRIKAKTNRLFLALNSHFGDLTVQNSFSVTVNEVTGIAGAGAQVDHDTESDGAECQRWHYCQKDNDCATKLGWEYSCEVVTGIRTTWPTFDDHANELPNTGGGYQNLISILGGSNGQTKRCVYRGRGAACIKDYDAVTTSTQSYDELFGTNSYGHHACANNSHCESLSTANKFNNKISRYGRSAFYQNVDSNIVTNVGSTDEFGLGSRIIGRPFKYFGDQSVDAAIQTHFSSNTLTSICLPGKEINPTSMDTVDYNKQSLTADTADKLNNLGPASTSITGTTSNSYYASCPAIYNDQHITKSNTTSGVFNNNDGKEVRRVQASQNINSLLIELIDPNNLALWKVDTSNGYYQGKGLTPGVCLRTPGSSCHTDFECAPSKFVGARLKSLDINDVNSGTQQTSEEELAFWQEDLVCSQKYTKYHDFYDPEENRCCREIGKVLKIDTNRVIVETGVTITASSGLITITGSNGFSFMSNTDDCDANYSTTYSCSLLGYYNDGTNPAIAASPQNYKRGVAGIHYPDNDALRYSRSNMMYDRMTTGTTSGVFPQLDVLLPRSTINATTHAVAELSDARKVKVSEWNSYDTFHDIASRTCCSGNWVRNFHEDNGGGHTWNQGKKQNEIPMENFECINWVSHTTNPTTTPIDINCTIANYNTSACRARNLNAAERKSYLNFFGRLELLGIPQINVQSSHGYFGGANPGCSVNPNITANQSPMGYNSDQRHPIPGTTKGDKTASIATIITDTLTDAEYKVTNPGDDDYYYSGEDTENVDSDMKPVFSDSEATCCLPTGEFHGNTLQGSQCCTGFSDSANPGYCCLPDYTDVSVYLNRNVSSEAANLSATEFDKETGYIKDPRLVQQIQALKGMCCSGTAAFGRSIQDFKIRMFDVANTYAAPDNCAQRFVTGAAGDDADAVGNASDAYKAGLRWNDHLYCAPAGVTDDTPYAGHCATP